jgi:hypothetical protein
MPFCCCTWSCCSNYLSMTLPSLKWLPKEHTPRKDPISESLLLQRMQSRACLYYNTYICVYIVLYLYFISSRHIDVYLRGEEDILHVHDSSKSGFVFGRLVQLLLRMLGTGKKGKFYFFLNPSKT